MTATHLTQEQIERVLHIKDGETTKDMKFSLETVNCLGTCALAPVTMIDEEYYGEVAPGGVEKILSAYCKGSDSVEDEED